MFDKVRVWGVAGIVSYLKRLVAFSIHRKRLAELATRSANRVPERGITVIGDLTGQVSLSKTLRDFVLCLIDAGIPCQAYDTCLRAQIPASDARNIVTPLEKFDLRRYSHIVMMYRSPLDKRLVPQQTCARIVFHDSEHGIHDTAPYLRESGDGIIAMSDFNYRYFQRMFSGQPVYKIIYPFRFGVKDATPREVLRAKYGIPGDAFVVFFNFDFGSYYRKNVVAALRAFSLAFKDDTSAMFVLKTKGSHANRKQVAEMESVIRTLGIQGQVVHIHQYLPRADVDGLTAACDVYLSLHKSEGFGLGMAEAMSQGKPVVATNWSGNTEFCTPETAWCVPYRLVPVLPHEYPVATKEWAEADVEAAARALREIRDDPTSIERAANGARFIAEHFALEVFKKSVEAFLDGKTFCPEGAA